MVLVGSGFLWISAGRSAYGLREGLGIDEKTWEPFFETISLLKEKFISDKPLEDKALMEEAIRGVLSALDDPYARYLDPEDFEIETSDRVEGEFSGLGLVIAIKDEKLTVVSPIKGSPAERAGIKAGDVITAIDGESTAGISLDRAVKKMRGEKGTKVVLEIEREGGEQSFSVEIIRDVISIQSVEYEIRPDGIGVVRISEFHGKTFNELRDAIFSLQDADVKGLVIDLRDNPGGLLPSALLCSGIFVPQNRDLLVIEDREGKREVIKNFVSPLWDRPLVILINKGTASGAEIMAGILRMALGVKLIGENTFGKGVVQEIFPLSHGGGVIFTVSKYYLADGTPVDKVGLPPDIEVKEEEKQVEQAVKELKVLLGSNEVVS
ncbi:MAG: S41 family peptidase [Atribacterota bacterium]|nr:S41 family peptidase [Atribacterota bacterium]